MKKFTAVCLLILMLSFSLIPVLSLTVLADGLPKGFKNPADVFGFNVSAPSKDGKSIRTESWWEHDGFYFDNFGIQEYTPGASVICNSTLFNDAWSEQFRVTSGREAGLNDYEVTNEPLTVLKKDSGPMAGKSEGKITASCRVTGKSSASETLDHDMIYERKAGDSMSMNTSFDLKVDILELGSAMRFAWVAVSGTVSYSYSMHTAADGSKSDTVTYTLPGYPEYLSCSIYNGQSIGMDDHTAYLVIRGVHPAGAEGGLTLRFELKGVLPKGGKIGNVTQDAEDEAGEDGGVSIPAAIVTGIAGTGAAVVGAAAALAGADGVSEEERRRKSYKMYVQKDFGDSLRKGAPPLTVRARIAEVDENGVEKDRNDLTARITTVSGGGAEIRSAALVGRYCEASVSVPEGFEGEDVTVTFTFEGEGGVFNDTVRFRVIGAPKIEFAESEIVTPVYTGDTCRVSMIAGAGLTVPLRFTLKDAASEPKPEDIRGENNDGFAMTFEKADAPFTYLAKLSHRGEKKDGTFFLPDETYTHVYVRCEGEKEPVTGSVYVTLVPEGLSVICRETEEDFMVVDTNKDENAGGLDSEIRPVGFETVLAFADGDVSRVVNTKEYEVSFGELDSDKGYAEAMRKSLAYEIETNRSDDKHFAFAPKVVLPQPKEPYEICIPLTAAHNGKTFTATLPIRLYGEQPKKPTDWEKEKALLQRALTRYGLGENEYLREQIRKARSMTANELRMLRGAIITEAMEYYTREALEFNSLDQSLGRYQFTFSCVKWIMDQGFSVVATMLYGPTAEAFMTPFKDLIGDFLGNLTASAYWGGELKSSWSDIGQTVLKGFENTLGNKMGDAVTEGSVKKLGGVIALFMAITFVEKFYWDEDAEGDVYKSLVATCNDLAGNAIKTAFSAKFGDALKNNPGIRDAVQKYFVKDFCKRFPNPNVSIGHAVKYATDSAMKLIDNSIEKYVTETLGLTATIFINKAESLYEKAADISFEGQAELDRISALQEAGKIDAKEAAVQAGKLAVKSVGEMATKDLFDIDIAVGDSTLRINLLDNVSAVASFLWDNTFGLLIPKDTKQVPVTDCTKYYRVL